MLAWPVTQALDNSGLLWGVDSHDPLELPDGTVRRFLEDGDRVTFTAYCQGDGYRVGFGELSGQVLAAE